MQGHSQPESESECPRDESAVCNMRRINVCVTQHTPHRRRNIDIHVQSACVVFCSFCRAMLSAAFYTVKSSRMAFTFQTSAQIYASLETVAAIECISMTHKLATKLWSSDSIHLFFFNSVRKREREREIEGIFHIVKFSV